MKTLVIEGNLRTALGKKGSKKLREQELVPCVLYGGEAPIHFQASFTEFRKLIYTPSVHLVDLSIEGKIYPSILQDIQWHPVEEQIMHVDFLLTAENKPVRIEIPINVIGFAKGIKAGGKLKTNIRKLKVKALPKHLPDTIDVNVEELGLGQSIKVGDLAIENVELLDGKTNVIATCVATRAVKATAAPAAAPKSK